MAIYRATTLDFIAIRVERNEWEFSVQYYVREHKTRKKASRYSFWDAIAIVASRTLVENGMKCVSSSWTLFG